MTTELAQLELLAHIDELVTQLSTWSAAPSPWETVSHGKSLVKRLLQRIEPLRARVEAPLVVATFGGTGVGKSSLVNALIGEEVTMAGRQRPTTTNPIVLAHPQTDLSAYDLPLADLKVVTRDVPLLRDIVLIDCPDPDTTEGEQPRATWPDCIACCRIATCCCMSALSKSTVRPKSATNYCRPPAVVGWCLFKLMPT
jgi:hypothetical protein